MSIPERKAKHKIRRNEGNIKTQEYRRAPSGVRCMVGHKTRSLNKYRRNAARSRERVRFSLEREASVPWKGPVGSPQGPG